MKYKFYYIFPVLSTKSKREYIKYYGTDSYNEDNVNEYLYNYTITHYKGIHRLNAKMYNRLKLAIQISAEKSFIDVFNNNIFQNKDITGLSSLAKFCRYMDSQVQLINDIKNGSYILSGVFSIPSNMYEPPKYVGTVMNEELKNTLFTPPSDLVDDLLTRFMKSLITYKVNFDYVY